MEGCIDVGTHVLAHRDVVVGDEASGRVVAPLAHHVHPVITFLTSFKIREMFRIKICQLFNQTVS